MLPHPPPHPAHRFKRAAHHLGHFREIEGVDGVGGFVVVGVAQEGGVVDHQGRAGVEL